MIPFFDRLDRIDGLIPWHIPSGAAVTLVGLVREPASARYLCDKIDASRPESASVVLIELAGLLPPLATRDYPMVADILETKAIELSLSGDADTPSPQTPMQLRALVRGLATTKGDLPAVRFAAVNLGLQRFDPVDVVDPRDLARLAVKALDTLGFEAAEFLLELTGVTQQPDRYRTRPDWWRTQFAGPVLSALVANSPDRAFRFYLQSMIRLLESDPTSDATSSMWRPEIAASPQRDDSRSHLIDGLLAAGGALLAEPDDSRREILDRLWHDRWLVLKRVALRLAVKVDAPTAFLAERVREVEQGGTHYEWEAEFKELVQARAETLAAAERRLLVDWVRRGPQVPKPPDLSDDDFAQATTAWERDWLAVLRPILSDADMIRLANLEEASGPASAKRWERGVRSGFVEQESPVSAAEMDRWRSSVVPQRLLEALDSPDMGWREEFRETSKEGLAREVALVLAHRPQWLDWLGNPETDSRVVELLLEAARICTQSEPTLDSKRLSIALTRLLSSDRQLSDTDLWSAASIASSLIGADWPEAGEAALAVSLVSNLVRRTSARRSLDGGDLEDPAHASVNTPAGMAANLAARLFLLLRQAGNLTTELESQLHVCLTGSLGREKVDTHASVGRWFGNLASEAPDLAAALRQSIFPRSVDLFEAAWGSYVRFGSLRPGAFERMADEYRRVASDGISDRMGAHARQEVVESTTQHFLVLAAWGDVAVGKQSVLAAWWGHLSTEEQVDAHQFLARQASDSEIDSATLKRMQAVVDWRLAASTDQAEFEHLGSWAEAPVEAPWLLAALGQVEPGHLSVMDGEEVLQFLAQDAVLSDVEERETAMRIVADLTTRADSWRLTTWQEVIEPLLEDLLSYDDARGPTIDLINNLGSWGLVGLRPLHPSTPHE